MPKPSCFYRSGGVWIYQGDSRLLLPRLKRRPDFLLTDPPYGLGYKHDNHSRGRGALTHSNDYPDVIGDSESFDPSYLLDYPRVVLFGANNFAQSLPEASGWIVWDKLDGMKSKRKLGFNDNADLELVWTNIKMPARIIPHRWMGAMKGSERNEARVHPTQKPIALMEKIIDSLASPGDFIVDPYMGAGSTLIAARRLGFDCLGIELSKEYCQIAKERLMRDAKAKG